MTQQAPAVWLMAVNVLLVGLWTGMYLFTTFVVSPVFREFFPDSAERNSRRRTVGRQYARINGPLTVLLLGLIVALGMVGGWTWPLLAEALLLALIGLLVAWHMRAAQASKGSTVPPAWLMHVILSACALLCGTAVWGAAVTLV